MQAVQTPISKTKDHSSQGFLQFLQTEGRPEKNYQYALRLLGQFYGGDLRALPVDEAQDFVSWCTKEKALSPQSVNTIITSLSAFYDYLEDRSEVAINPFSLIDRPRQGKSLPKYIPTEEDLLQILQKLEQFEKPGESLAITKGRYKVHVLAEFLYGTGMRISEASTVTLDDLDLENNLVTITDVKTRKKRYCVMSEYTSCVVRSFLPFREGILKYPDSPYLFGSTDYLKPQANALLKEVCVSLERDPITCHSFRHAFAYHLLKAGCDIRKIQGLLGHERLSSTQVYAKVDTESLKAVLDRYHPRRVKQISS